jgi:RHS repeat-associated protein
MLMPERSISSTAYKFGFNGKENDNEVKGEGNQIDYGMRGYDPRIGKPFSIDPLTHSYPHLSPYQFFSNNPILNIDLDGLEGVDYTRNIVLYASGQPRFAKEDAGNISRKAIYAFQINGTMHIMHNGKHISFNPSSAPTKIGLAFNPGFYFATNIKSFSDVLLKGKAGRDDLMAKVSVATGYIDGDVSKPVGNGFVNTFRHFAWQSTIAMALGEGTAKRAGDYHEADGIIGDKQKGAFAKDNVIDLLNNDYAREYSRGFKFSEVTKSAEAFAGYLNGLAKHVASTVDGYKEDKAFDSIRNDDMKLFDASDKNFQKLYDSAKNLDQVNAK